MRDTIDEYDIISKLELSKTKESRKKKKLRSANCNKGKIQMDLKLQNCIVVGNRTYTWYRSHRL